MHFKNSYLGKLIIMMGLFGMLKFFAGCSNSSLFFKYGYNVSDGHVYYKQSFPNPVIDMDEVDVATFKEIKRANDTAYADNGYYATDKNVLYYQGYRVPGSDGPSFEILNVNFSKDKGQVYFRGTLIKDADPATFAIKGGDFSADKAHVFRREMTIDNDASLFETFNDGYMAHTANSVSVYDDVVQIPAGAPFKYLGFSYFALGNQVYFHNDKLVGGDAANFTALDNFYCKTGGHIYYGKKIITDADAASYTLIASPYGRDDRHVFFFERIIDGADVHTFEIINPKFDCARDKNALYHEDKRVTHFTKADLTNKNLCTNCNEAAVYFADSTK